MAGADEGNTSSATSRSHGGVAAGAARGRMRGGGKAAKQRAMRLLVQDDDVEFALGRGNLVFRGLLGLDGDD